MAFSLGCFWFPSRKARWGPKAAEPIHIPQAFQDGRNAHSERPAAERRLDDKNRHQRSSYSCISRFQSICSITIFCGFGGKKSAFSLHAFYLDWHLPPRIFTNYLEANRGFLKSRSVVYVDDLLLLHQDKENSQQQPYFCWIHWDFWWTIPSRCSNQLKLWYSLNLQKELSLSAK